MARNYPAHVRMQNFYTEQFGKEDSARLQFYYDNKRGASGSAGARRKLGVPDGLPSINPMQFGRKMKKDHEKFLADIAVEAEKSRSKYEMYPVEPYTREPLYKGFTKEEKGRYAYLKDRNQVVPEKKYSFPILSSWEYGWKIGDNFNLKKSKHARTRLIQDSFYTRNAVPDLNDPTMGFTIEKSKTFMV